MLIIIVGTPETFAHVGMMMVDTCASAPSTTKSKVNKQPKPNQRRVYDANGYRRRVDCMCFQDETRSEVSPIWHFYLQNN